MDKKAVVEGCDGESGEVQEGGYICTHTADLLHCTGENENKTGKQLYSNF